MRVLLHFTRVKVHHEVSTSRTGKVTQLFRIKTVLEHLPLLFSGLIFLYEKCVQLSFYIISMCLSILLKQQECSATAFCNPENSHGRCSRTFLISYLCYCSRDCRGIHALLLTSSSLSAKDVRKRFTDT